MSTEVQQAIVGVWEKYEDEEWRKDQSHWRGVGRWKDDARWQAIGQGTLAKVRMIWRHLGRPPFPEPLVALEWGPGGGSNLLAMRRHCRAYFGVDIAASNLAECGRMIAEEGFGDLLRPVLLTAEPDTIAETVTEKLDLFISTAVFQHFPSKSYGGDVLKAVAGLCKPGAIGVVQIRYDNGNEKFAPISDISQYKKKHITANSYQIDEFWNLLRESGFQPIMISDINSAVNYATFYFQKSAA